MSRLEMITDDWLIKGGKSPLPLWPSITRKITIQDQSETVIAKLGGFAELRNGKPVVGQKLFFADPDPFKEYHDELEQEEEDE
jgi:hypothetical protein